MADQGPDYGRLGKIGGYVVLALVVGGFFGAMVYDVVVHGPEAEEKRRVLESEFRSFPVPQEARERDCHKSSKPRMALFGCVYASSIPYELLRAHYDAALGKAGWSPCGEQPYQGGWRRLYCKTPYRGELELVGHGGSGGWDYGMDLEWRQE